MASNSQPTKASPGTPAEIERAIKHQLEQQRRYRLEADQSDGRPKVDRLSHTSDDPLLQALKEGKR